MIFLKFLVLSVPGFAFWVDRTHRNVGFWTKFGPVFWSPSESGNPFVDLDALLGIFILLPRLMYEADRPDINAILDFNPVKFKAPFEVYTHAPRHLDISVCSEQKPGLRKGRTQKRYKTTPARDDERPSSINQLVNISTTSYHLLKRHLALSMLVSALFTTVMAALAVANPIAKRQSLARVVTSCVKPNDVALTFVSLILSVA